jgi:hypothetical protein
MSDGRPLPCPLCGKYTKSMQAIHPLLKTYSCDDCFHIFVKADITELFIYNWEQVFSDEK